MMNITRTRVLQIWFAVVAVLVAVAMMFGSPMTGNTATMLVLVSLIPPVMVLMLWPRDLAPTAADVLYDRDRRG